MSADPPPAVTIVADPATHEVTAEAAGTGLHQPGRFVTPFLWCVIVGSACLVYIAAAFCLMAAFLFPPPPDTTQQVEVAIILLIFNTPFTFLCGLVLPSPVQRR